MKNSNFQIRKPAWLKIKPNYGPEYIRIKKLLREFNLHTVCQEANCPNIGECFTAGTTTFIIMGNKCTRNCRFCDIKPGHSFSLDPEESENVARAVKKLELKFAVITSVTRDDLPDGGAKVFSQTVNLVKNRTPDCKIEILIPDFGGKIDSLNTVIESSPDVIAHNIETVPDLYPAIRPQADYARSLNVLNYIASHTDKPVVKSGIMVGLGENLTQINQVLKDSAFAGCQIFTIGQYLSPSENHHPVEKYYTPEEFRKLKKIGEEIGILHVESGPLVRSSYMAHFQTEKFYQKLNR